MSLPLSRHCFTVSPSSPHDDILLLSASITCALWCRYCIYQIGRQGGTAPGADALLRLGELDGRGTMEELQVGDQDTHMLASWDSCTQCNSTEHSMTH